MSYTNISPSFNLILSSIHKKQEKKNFLKPGNIHDDAINFEACGSTKNTKI